MDFARLKPELKLKIEQGLAQIDVQSFLYGLAGILAFYILLLLYAMLGASSTIEKLELQLAAQTIPIERAAVPVSHSAAENNAPSVALPTAPEEGLHEKTDKGLLPVVRETDKATPFSFYKRPYTYPKVDRPVIAFVVTDYGLSDMASQTAIKDLPSDVSFVISAYANHPQRWVDAARENGHEVWLGLPMESKSGTRVDPGPAGILARSNLQSNQDSMRWSLSRAAGYAGVAAFSDDSFYRAELLLENLVSELFKRGLGYLELNKNSNSKIAGFALQANAPHVKADLWIEKNAGKERSFEKLRGIVEQNGYALAIIQGYPANIKRLAAWVTQNQHDYLFVPASAYYDAPLHASGFLKDGTGSAPIVPKPLKDADHFEPETHH